MFSKLKLHNWQYNKYFRIQIFTRFFKSNAVMVMFILNCIRFYFACAC